MSRFLFIMPPFAGHINPAIGVAAELAARGHRVAWAGDAAALTTALPPGSVIHPCGPGVGWSSRPPNPREPAPTQPLALERPEELRGFAALKFLWERVLLPLADAMLPGVLGAVADEEPDLLIVDQQAFAGALVAERMRLPWATSASTSAELTDPLAAMPKAREWVQERMTELHTAFGDPSSRSDLRFSPHLVLGYTSPALLGPVSGAPEKLRLVGPVLRPEKGTLTGISDGKPLVYVSIGTVNAEAGARFLRGAADAIGAKPELHGLIADPGGALSTSPSNVDVRSSVPQLAVLERAAAVVCHGGHNTVCESLAHGVPLVVAPIRDDQPIVAEQVRRAGAGVRLRFPLATAEHIGRAIDTVLSEPSYRHAANTVRQEFRAAGGATAAADQLTELAVPVSA